MVYQARGRGAGWTPALTRDRLWSGLLLIGVLAVAFGGHGLLGPADVAAGLVNGAGLALQVLGVVLVFRAQRVINFAQVQLGLVGSALFAALVQHHQLIGWVQDACSACLPGSAAQAPAWAVDGEYALALVAALALSALLSFLAYYLLLRRFQAAPRLVLTVATIGLAQVLAWAEAQVPHLFVSVDQFGLVTGAGAAAGAGRPPFDFAIVLAGTRFAAADLLTVASAVAACGMLALFLAGSRAGVSVRGSADNPDRARTLGIDVDRVTAIVWVGAGLLSGVAGVLQAMGGRLDTSAPPSVAALVGILAAALIARFESLAWAVAAAVVLGIASISSLRWFGSSDPYEALLILLIGAALLGPARPPGRAEQEPAWSGAREARPVPQALRALPAVRNALGWAAGIALLLVFGLPFVLSPTQLELGAETALLALVGLSLLVLTGWAGQISLGQMAIAACGAYVTVLLALGYGLAFPVCLLAAALVGGVAAAIVGLPALRLRGLNLTVLTLALAVAVPDVLLNPSYLGAALQNEVLNRPFFFGIDLNDDRAFYYLCLLVLQAALAGVFWLRRSRAGRVLIAARDNPQAARALGVSVFRARLGAFVVAGVLAGLAGSLLAYEQRGVPVLSYGPDAGVQVFLMTVVGGLGSLAGPLLGALYLAAAVSLPGSLTAFLVTGGGVVAVLLVAPGGLAQLAKGARDAWLRRLAVHRRIEAPSLLGDAGLAPDAAPLLPVRAGAPSPPLSYRLDLEQESVGG